MNGSWNFECHVRKRELSDKHEKDYVPWNDPNSGTLVTISLDSTLMKTPGVFNLNNT